MEGYGPPVAPHPNALLLSITITYYPCYYVNILCLCSHWQEHDPARQDCAQKLKRERSQCWARLGSSMLGAKVGETERSVGVGERLIEFCGFWLGFRGTSGMRAERPWTSLLRTVRIRSRGLLFCLSVIFMGFSLKTWCSASSRGSGWAVPLKSSGLDRGPIEELRLRQREAGAHMLGGSGSLPHLVHGLVFAGRASDPCH